jgi:hypothetical protein
VDGRGGDLPYDECNPHFGSAISHPAGETPENVSEIEAIDVLNRYWRKVGLVQIDGHPGFLGQSTAFTALPEARRALRHVEDVEIPVDIDDPRLEVLTRDTWP